MPSKRTAKHARRARASEPAMTGMVVPVGVIQPERIEHAITHSARILQKLQEVPDDHPSRPGWEQALADYRDLIQQAGSIALHSAHERLRARGIHDMTPAKMKASVRHLEG